nr:hypothetical protein [Tanacetum cinerariifolium]
MSLSLAENVIFVGADNRPPMLDKTNYSSWASQPGNETIPATIRTQTYTDLTGEENIHESVDIKATNIVLQGPELSFQERESKLYDDFDTFTSMPGETFHSYYMRFAQLINDIHTIGMTMKPLQVNIKFVNPLQLEWIKFVTDLRTSSNPRNQATIQDGKITVQTVQVRQTQGYASNGARNTTTNHGLTGKGQPKNSTWFKKKLLLTEALESGAYLDREQSSFLVDNGDTVIPAQASQEILTPAAFQTDDLDAFDSDCDDIPLTKAVLMANLSSYDLDVLLELRETFQAWLQQQVVNLHSYSLEPLQYQKIPIYYDDDDDEENSTPLRGIIIYELPPCITITLVLSIEEPKDSLIMGDEHVDTISEKESDEFIKSSVENLVPSPNSLIISSSKIDSLLDEFADELIFLKSIPPGIYEADCDPEKEICLIEKLLYDNSSPRPSEEFNSKNSDAVIESFSPSPIPVEDIDYLMEEIDLSLTPDDSMPSGIKNDDYDFEGDILFLEEFLSNDSL